MNKEVQDRGEEKWRKESKHRKKRGQDWLEDDGERKGDKKEVQNV